jgi:hypothetical protein
MSKKDLDLREIINNWRSFTCDCSEKENEEIQNLASFSREILREDLLTEEEKRSLWGRLARSLGIGGREDKKEEIQQPQQIPEPEKKKVSWFEGVISGIKRKIGQLIGIRSELVKNNKDPNKIKTIEKKIKDEVEQMKKRGEETPASYQHILNMK